MIRVQKEVRCSRGLGIFIIVVFAHPASLALTTSPETNRDGKRAATNQSQCVCVCARVECDDRTHLIHSLSSLPLVKVTISVPSMLHFIESSSHCQTTSESVIYLSTVYIGGNARRNGKCVWQCYRIQSGWQHICCTVEVSIRSHSWP